MMDQFSSKVDLKVQEIVQKKIEIEMRSINAERARLEKQMLEEIEFAKQRRLADIESRMQDILDADNSFHSEYEALAPDFYLKFTLKHSKHKPIKPKGKPRRIQPKDTPVKKINILNDLALFSPTSLNNSKSNFPQNYGESQLILNSGQQWDVNIQPVSSNITKLTYFDNSNSFISRIDQKTIGLNIHDCK